jgi:hypothetical protein
MSFSAMKSAAAPLLFTWAISLRYRPTRTRADYLKFFRSLAKKHDLKSYKAKSRVFKGFSDAAMHSVAKKYLGLIPERKLEFRHLKTSHRRDRLRRPVVISSFTFRNAKTRSFMQIDCAPRNDFPCIGVDLWLKKRLLMPGGFVELKADRETMDQLFNEICAFMKLVRPRHYPPMPWQV